MSGVFDRLQKKLQVDKHEEGISALALADLPPNLRKLMRLMLREVEMFYQDLCTAVSEMPEASRLSQKELDEALETLTQQFWLIRRGEGERVRYQVNLRRKAGSKIAQGLWANLNTRIAQSQAAPPPVPGGEEPTQDGP